MRRAAAITLLVFLAAGTACAAEKPAAGPSLAAEQQYIDRLLAMDDSAAAHVALAKWCEANAMPQRAKTHWGEALQRDPANAEARAALGFVKRGLEWVPAAEAGPAPIKPAPAAGPPAASRRQAFREEVSSIMRQYLFAPDATKWAEGRRKILQIRDPAAAEPIAQVLGAGGAACRALAAQVLGQIPGDEALRYLLGYVLADEPEEVRRAAVESLKGRTEERIAQQLIYALARGQEPTKRRAAQALGELSIEEAVPALITNLRLVQFETVLVKEIRTPEPISGTSVPFIAGARPVVAPGVVAYKPLIGYITPTGVVIPGVQQPQEVLVQKVQPKIVDQPIVLEALKKITGEDFGYDQVRWRQWLEKQQRERAKAAPDAPAKP